MATSSRVRGLLLTLTHSQHNIYQKAIKEIDKELHADLGRPFVLQDKHKLFVIERVITNKPVDINEALLSVTPNPSTQKYEKLVFGT